MRSFYVFCHSKGDILKGYGVYEVSGGEGVKGPNVYQSNNYIMVIGHITFLHT